MHRLTVRSGGAFFVFYRIERIFSKPPCLPRPTLKALSSGSPDRAFCRILQDGTQETAGGMQFSQLLAGKVIHNENVQNYVHNVKNYANKGIL